MEGREKEFFEEEHPRLADIRVIEYFAIEGKTEPLMMIRRVGEGEAAIMVNYAEDKELLDYIDNYFLRKREEYLKEVKKREEVYRKLREFAGGTDGAK